MKYEHDIVEQEMLSCFSKIIFYTLPNTDMLKEYFFAILPIYPSLHTYSGNSSPYSPPLFYLILFCNVFPSN